MTGTGPLTFCLIVPSGSWAVDAVASSIRRHHDHADVVSVWCGDPHHRPAASPDGSWGWADLDLAEPTGVGWGVLLAGLPPRAYEWSRAAAALTRLVDAGRSNLVALRVGSAAVLGDCTAFGAATKSVTLVRRPRPPVNRDGLAPAVEDLLHAGRFSTVMLALGPAAAPMLRWLGEQLVAASVEHVGPWFDLLAERFGLAEFDAPGVLIGGWSSPASAPVSLVDLDDLDTDQPWHFDFDRRPARVRLSADGALADVVAAARPQLMGTPAAVALPGGITLDHGVVGCVRAAIARWRFGDGALPPAPFGATNSAFVAWLEQAEPWGPPIGRYWMETWAQRADLRTVYPQPLSLDEWRFREWVDAAWRLEDGFSAAVSGFVGADRTIVSAGHDPSGVNVLGYFDFDQSQGHVARELVAALAAAGTPVAALNHDRSQGPRRASADDVPQPREAKYATNVVVVNADQFEFVIADHGDTLIAGRRTIGYWFWELEEVPARLVRAIDHVDEIWAGSEFIAEAFRRVTDKPVQCVALPIVEPAPSNRSRASFGWPEDAYVFLTTFDQFSVPERKNPFGVIEAFRRAFADGDGPMLVVKTINGARSWSNHERLLLAAAGRSDITVWDEHLSRADQMAVLANADCLVSLHRSEGLGMHCAEAMWLSKPVIATAYSGNVDFMDETVAAMIGYELVPVVHGEGIYPDGALWADPDLDQAAQWMRRLVAEPQVGVALGQRARQRMVAQPSLAETGARIARFAGVHNGSGDMEVT